ncbi:MAG: hypothetical protein K5695_12755 [Oscillospiraceae bacterium]|nr:hypothetical protein [Oscillospiraceae bacterium]
MDMLAYIDSRLSYWRGAMKRAEGRYHSDAQSLSEAQRQGHLAECRKCSAVIRELEMLREEVVEHGQKD